MKTDFGDANDSFNDEPDLDRLFLLRLFPPTLLFFKWLHLGQIDDHGGLVTDEACIKDLARRIGAIGCDLLTFVVEHGCVTLQ